jgi:prepilin-type N-terminal cleavage/methylation domain-containing protein
MISTKTFQRAGFTLIELMIVVALLTFLIASTYNTFLTGQSLWTKVDRSIELEENLRQAFDRITPELSMSGHDKQGFFQVWLGDNGGAGGSDILRFSIPVVCQTGGNIVDAEGNAAHWGAPLTWGCSQPSCMDQDNNCDTVEYKYIEYRLNDRHQLVRRVLDYSQQPVHEEVVASRIADFQTEPNFNQRVLTLTLKAETNLLGKSKSTAELKRDVYLRNSR